MLHILAQFTRLLKICAGAPGGRGQLALFAIIVTLELGSVYAGVRLVQWTGEFYAAIQKVEGPEIVRQIGIFVIIIAVNSMRGLTANYLRKKLEIVWRGTITDHAIDLWTTNKAYWHLANSSADRIDNPDQRIAEDCRIFINKILGEALDLIGRIVGLFSYLAILWGLSNFPLSLSFIGIDVDIPRYMVWAAFLYVALSTVITHFLGRPLKGLLSEQQRREANFRFSMARWRTAFDEVALAGGEAAEKATLRKRFDDIADNWLRLMRRELALGAFTFPFQHSVLRIPLFVALPGYIAGHVAFGGLMQLSMAFSNMVTTLSWFIFSYRDLSELVATSSRLDRFIQAARAEAASDRSGFHRLSGDDLLQFRNAIIRTPEGRKLLSLRELSIRQGETVCLCGASGIGKTTLTKALAGLWRHGSGDVTLPTGSWMLLPQKAYMPEGGVFAGAAYPFPSASFDAQAISEALEAVGLSRLVGEDRASAASDGGPEGLSGGELQRLAIARLLLHRPDWVVLDEATSALDDGAQAELLLLLRERLKDATLILITHRPPAKLAMTRVIDLGKHAETQVAIA